LADASNVGFRLEDIPVAPGATNQEALSGGEDYELLITTANVDRLFAIYESRGLAKPIVIGEIVRNPLERTCDGETLERLGWQHQL
jgi:thiamine-monophosphate kinase